MPFFKEYRNFASAAKEAGFNDADERKLIGWDPDLLLEGVSEKFRDSLTADMLVDFFKVLQKDASVDAKRILAIGNFLYEFRPDKRRAVQEAHSLDALAEKELRLIRLACKLVEDAFYKGNLVNLPGEQAASLAFTVNVLAKILEDNSTNEKLKSFNQDKLVNFIKQVVCYEQQKLFPGMIEEQTEQRKGENGVQTSYREQAIEEQKKNIIEKMEQAKKLKPTNGWLDYFKDLPDKLDDASKIIKRSTGVSDWCKKSLDEITGWLRFKLPEVIEHYETTISEISRTARTDYIPSVDLANFYSDLYCSLSQKLLDAGRLPNGISREYIIARVRDVRNMYEGLKKQVESFESAGKKAKVVNSFNEIGKISIAIELPEAVKALAFIIDEKPEGVWGDYLGIYKKVAKMLMKMETIKKTDVMFINAQERLLEQIKNKKFAVAPYLIKSCLIADNMTGLGLSLNNDQRVDSEEALARLEYPFNLRAGEPSDHSFSVEKKGRGDDVPAYARLHFIPEDMPFAVWALKYLRSRAEGQSKNKNYERHLGY